MRVPLDIPAWRLNPQCERTWGQPSNDAPTVVKFALVGRTDLISADVIDGAIEIFPERSSQHTALRAALVG